MQSVQENVLTKSARDCCFMADDAAEDAAEDADPELPGERTVTVKCSLGRLRITPALRLAIESVATRLQILSARGSLIAAEAITQQSRELYVSTSFSWALYIFLRLLNARSPSPTSGNAGVAI